MVHIISTAEQHSQPMNPHSLLLERLPLSADRREIIGFVIINLSKSLPPAPTVGADVSLLDKVNCPREKILKA